MDLDAVFSEMESNATSNDSVTCVINDVLRIITVPDTDIVFGVEKDKDVNKIGFEMDRYYRENDMSEFSARIYYQNANGDKNYTTVTDLSFTEDKITFSWTVPAYALLYAGSVRFAVNFIKIEGDVIQKAFNTTIATGTCLEGMYVDEQIPEEEFEDYLTHLKNDVKAYTDEQLKLIDAAMDSAKREISDAEAEALLNIKQAAPALPSIGDSDAGKAVTVKEDNSGYELTGPYASIDTRDEVNDIRVGEDGIHYPTAGDAVREQFSKVITGLSTKVDNSITRISTNRFDKEKVSIGTLNPKTGEIYNQDSSSTYVSDYCDIKTQNNFGSISLGRSSGENWLDLQSYAFYDENKEYISGNFTYVNPLSVPLNAKYIRFQVANITHANNAVCNVGFELFKNDFFYYIETITIPTKTSELENDSGFLTQDDKIFLTFENEALKKRCMSLENLNKFSWSSFDKGYITLIFDDGSSDLGIAYEIAKEYGLFISGAVPPERLSNPLSGSSLTGTVKDACNAIVQDGGEILSHSLHTLNRDDVTEQDFYQYFVLNKLELEEAGFAIDGIMTAGAGYKDKSVTLKWAKTYYLYSDSEGYGQGFPQYSKSRYGVYGNSTTNNIDQIKMRISNAAEESDWLVLCFHTISESSVLGTSESLLRDLFGYIKEYIDSDKLQNVTYRFMYNTFGSTELEQRLLKIEKIIET